jgi:serine phosphatase RsbU (regulator of sigma subunit)
VGVGGLLTTVLLFFVTDLLWRSVIPTFFPQGDLRSAGAFRLPVLGRMLIVLLLVGVLPPVVLASLSWQRAQALLAAPNPQTVLSNMFILQVFVVVTGVMASAALALFMTRSITGPLAGLQRAMKRVEQSDFDVRVPVTSDDELGYLSAGLNEMVAGLKEREEIRDAHQKVERELAVAWTIQQSFLPSEIPQLVGWQLAATLEPARQTSGDFYDWIPLPNGHLGILVADVADKGTGAALYMALSRTLIRTYATEHPSHPALALAAANRRLRIDSQADLFVTVFYGVLDPESGTLTYCNAGHNPPYLLCAEGEGDVQELGITGLPLGILDDGQWGQGAAHMCAGDLLVLYSDGITEAQDAQQEFFGKDRLLAAVRAGAGRSAAEVQEAVLSEVQGFVRDAPQFDDMTLVIVGRESQTAPQQRW